MRLRRSKADPEAAVGYYHCISRVVNREFLFGTQEKERFVAFMRAYELFCGVHVVTCCVMSSHFHIFVAVPHRPAPKHLPSDEELVALARAAHISYGADRLEEELALYREEGNQKKLEKLRERFFRQMWDVSWFMKLLKQRFSHW